MWMTWIFGARPARDGGELRRRVLARVNVASFWKREGGEEGGGRRGM